MCKQLSFVGLVLLLYVQLGSCYILSCYFDNRAQYRPGAGKFFPTDVDPCLCDHLIYASADLKGNKIVTSEWNDVTLYRDFNALKKRNSNLKTLLSVGGFSTGMARFRAMVGLAVNRKTFINSVIKFVRKHNFDGVDLAWEHPGLQRTHQQDMKFLTDLAVEMMAAFEAEGWRTRRNRLILTCVVTPGKRVTGFWTTRLARTLDYFHVKTHDFLGSGEEQTRENSPLYSGFADQGEQIYMNVNYAMNYWLNQGAPASKLLVGFPTYGRTFMLASSSNTGVGAPTTGPGPAGPYTRQSGFLAYYEICTFLQQGGTAAWDTPQNVPYAYNGWKVWVGYDNVKSFNIKVQWLKQNNFGGAVVWTIDLDDFSGTFCGQGQYPLIHTLKSRLGTGQSEYQNPSPPVFHYFCVGKANGLYPDPANKNQYYACNKGQAYIQHCATGLVFNPSCSCCKWA
ncbi:acidic mammalian chitinase-like isoform X2 [Arapaima gigas]